MQKKSKNWNVKKANFVTKTKQKWAKGQKTITLEQLNVRYGNKSRVNGIKQNFCHLTRKDSEVAQQTCNLNVVKDRYCFIQNASHSYSKYDSHLFTETSMESRPEWINQKVIPSSIEFFIAARWVSLKFIDSVSFLESILDSLQKYCPKRNTKKNKKELCKNYEISTKKLYFPYDYLIMK